MYGIGTNPVLYKVNESDNDLCNKQLLYELIRSNSFQLCFIPLLHPSFRSGL